MGKYVSPKIEFRILEMRENIADTCWGYSSNGQTSEVMYWDIPGEGYISFQLGKAKACSDPSIIGAKYYIDKNSEGVALTVKQEQDLIMELTSRGGNNGQNYNGISKDFPLDPNPGWS